jgi:hypothetical protein
MQTGSSRIPANRQHLFMNNAKRRRPRPACPRFRECTALILKKKTHNSVFLLQN